MIEGRENGTPTETPSGLRQKIEGLRQELRQDQRTATAADGSAPPVVVRARGTIRVAVADDSEPVRALVRALVSIESDMEFVGEAADGAAALELVAETEPDVLVLDLAMPRLNGHSVLARLRDSDCATRIVVYSACEEPDSARAAHELGAAACLVKGVSPAALIESLRAAGRGLARIQHVPPQDPSPAGVQS
jgi:CheY-like chemotaxis protein